MVISTDDLLSCFSEKHEVISKDYHTPQSGHFHWQ
jgi:hypothetical protein